MTAYAGSIKIWNGSSWEVRPVNIKDVSAFNKRPVRAYYNGQWNLIQSWVNPSQIYTDDFSSYSNAALAGQGPWVSCFNSANIIVQSSEVGSTAQTSAECCTKLNKTFNADQYAKATLTNLDGISRQIGVAVRASGVDGTANYYMFYGAAGTGNTVLGVVVNGSWYFIAVASTTPFSVGDTIGLKIQGTTIICLKNGTVYNDMGSANSPATGSNGIYTDTRLSSGQPGISAYTGSSADTAFETDFECGNTTNYADDFSSYSAGALGGQGNWVACINTIEVTADDKVKGYANDLCTVIYNGGFNNNQRATLQITTIDNGGSYGVSVCVRASGSGATGTYYALYGASGGGEGTILYKVVNGSATALCYTGFAIAAGETIELKVDGTTLTCLKNGIIDTTMGAAINGASGNNGVYTDSSIASGQPGIMIWGTGARGGYFECANL
jgi:hypothetical protein